MNLQGHTILIVDKRSVPFVKSLQDHLEAAGAETLVVRDADQAAHILRCFDFTTVLLGPSANPPDLLNEIGGIPLVAYGHVTEPRTVVASVVGLKE
jgi:hypothetical protein